MEIEIPGYESFEFVAEGSMGLIYRTIEIETGKVMAYKQMNPIYANDKWVLSCLRNEFGVAKHFDNINLVTAYRWHKNGPGFFMDFIEGEELKSFLDNELITFKERKTIILGICDALGYMHEKMSKSYLHLDIKPENVIVRSVEGDELLKRSHIVLLDYGTAQEVIKRPKIFSLQGIKDILSDQKIIGGSFLYMSPEQSRVEDLDERSDIYSLGCLMFEVFTGRPPFVSKFMETRSEGCKVLASETSLDRQELKTMHCYDAPPDPRQFNAKISPQLAELILKCLQKKPNRRFSTVTKLSLELQRLTF